MLLTPCRQRDENYYAEQNRRNCRPAKTHKPNPKNACQPMTSTRVKLIARYIINLAEMLRA
jgi:hypothetical protein